MQGSYKIYKLFRVNFPESTGRHLAVGSESPVFEFWFHQIDFGPLGKALNMHFLTTLMFEMSIWLKAFKDLVSMLEWSACQMPGTL